MKLKGIFILLITVVSLLPLYMFYKYLERVMRPRESLQRFLGFMIVILLLVFIYTFSLVFLIKLTFPDA